MHQQPSPVTVKAYSVFCLILAPSAVHWLIVVTLHPPFLVSSSTLLPPTSPTKMRQDDNYQGNFNQLFSAGMQERLRSAHVVTDLQRIVELQVSSQKGLCKSTKKKGILKNLLSHREQFLSLAKSLDTAFNSNLHDALERIIPSRTEIFKGDNHASSL